MNGVDISSGAGTHGRALALGTMSRQWPPPNAPSQSCLRSINCMRLLLFPFSLVPLMKEKDQDITPLKWDGENALVGPSLERVEAMGHGVQVPSLQARISAERVIPVFLELVRNRPPQFRAAQSHTH